MFILSLLFISTYLFIFISIHLYAYPSVHLYPLVNTQFHMRGTYPVILYTGYVIHDT